MKKVKSKLVTKLIKLNNNSDLSDEQLIKRQLGYSSSSIYDSVLKYCRQNYLHKKSKQS